MTDGESLAKRKTMNLLSHRDHSEKELRVKLLRSGFSEAESDETIQFMKEAGYLDDERYARLYVELNEARKSGGHIVQELRKRGVAGEVIERVMEGCEGEEEALRRAMDKKVRQLGTPLTKEKAERLKAYLYRQGYRPESIRRHLVDVGCHSDFD